MMSRPLYKAYKKLAIKIVRYWKLSVDQVQCSVFIQCHNFVTNLQLILGDLYVHVL